MKAIILAAGKGVRMRPLTYETPKSLIKIKGKPVIEHIFESLPSDISEVIVVVKHLGDRIKEYLGDEFKGRRVTFVEGSEKGTAYSFLAAKPHLAGEFLVLYGDEFPQSEDVRRCLKQGLSAITFTSHNPKLHGMASLRSDGTIAEIVEKPENFEGKMAVGGIMVLNEKIFNYSPYPNSKGEYYLTSLLNQFIKDHRVMAVPSSNFIGDITTPADLERVEKLI